MKNIRKISIGNGHPDNMMHYQIGKEYNLSGVKYKLSDIILDEPLFKKGKIAFNLYLVNEFGTILWKTIIDVPLIIENNITFE